MKNKSKFIISYIAILCMLLFLPCFSANVYAATILETDVSAPSDGCVMLGVYGSYFSQAQEALDRINEIRKEACDAGNVPDPRNKSRMLTSSDYVPIKWSRDLESVARIRAVEGGLAYGFMGTGHSRFNEKSVFSVKFNGVQSYAEDLAYNWGTSMVYGINQWYEEKEYWVNQVSGEVTGHYTSMINPDFTYVGLGDFYTEEARYPNTLAGQFSDSLAALDQTMQDAPTDVMQKIEVKSSYITGYILEGEHTLYTDDKAALTLKAVLTNGSATHRLWVLDEVTYTSSNPLVATIDDEGVVTGLRHGTTTITVKKDDSTVTTAEITVKCDHARELKETTLPTCTSTGLKVYGCETCGGEIEEVLSMKAHVYSYGEADAEGYRTGTCAQCGAVICIIPPTAYTLFWNTEEMGTYYTGFPSGLTVGSDLYCWPSGVNGDSAYRTMVIESTDESVISVPEVVITDSHQNHLKVLRNGITTLTIYPLYNVEKKWQRVVRVGSTGSVDFLPADVSLSQAAYEYSGSACTPSVEVSYHDTVLTKGTDYTVSYENNTEIGTASVVITGKGIFAGTIRKEFVIAHTKHEPVVDPAVAATCTEEGLTEGSHCLICGETIVAQTVVGALNHAYADGKCERCGDVIYVNSNGLTYTILKDAQDFCVSVAAQDGVTLTGTVNIPSTVVVGDQVYRVTTIGENAFDGQSEVESLTVPGSVTEVEAKAFAQCSNLESVKFLGKTAPSVSDDIFEGSSKVEIIVSEDATGFAALAESTGVTCKVAHIHEMTYCESVEATCQADGSVAYYYCEGCDGLYEDVYGETPIGIEDTVIASPGHSWNSYYTIDIPATATTDGSKSIHCARCEETKDATAIPATGTPEVPNTPNAPEALDKNVDNNAESKHCPAVGSVFEVKGLTYQVMKAEDEAFTVCCIKANSKKIRTCKIPDVVDYNGDRFQVVSIGKEAFAGCSKLKSVTIGKNVTKIGAKAFDGCKKLKTITIKSKALKAGKIGKNAFRGIRSNVTVKVPKKKLKAYKKMLRKKGISAKAKYKAV